LAPVRSKILQQGRSRIFHRLLRVSTNGTFILKDGLIRRMSYGRRWLRVRPAGIDTDRAAPVGSPVEQGSN
jgi:hypothetical protein